MEDGGLGNNHLNFHGGSENRLSAESLPLIDIRLLSQSELRSLAHCSSLSPSFSGSLASSAGGDDDLTPKIDRTVFNESAGSRKQTFLRLRLARHPQPPGPPSPQCQRDDFSREENLQVASLLRSLFNVDSIQSKEEDDEGDEELEDNEGQPPFSFPIHNNGNFYKNPYFESVQNVLIQGTCGSEIKRKRGRPRKMRNPSDAEINGETDFSAYATDSVDKTFSNLGTESRYGGSGISIESNSSKRKRGRPPKNRNGFNKPAMKCKSEDKELVNLENRECPMVDLSASDKKEFVNLENREGRMVDPSALANASEDPYGEELRRITDGLKSKEEILSFLEQLDGKWVNAGKQKKLVKACDFGAYLPRGWKLILCIKRKFSNVWLTCRRYISPDGQQFETCKEVSMYLQSLLESRSRNQLNSLQSENKTLGQPVMANKDNSDSMGLPVLGSETKHSLESRRTNSEVCEEPKGAENGDVADRVNTSRLEKDDDKEIPAGEFLNGDNNDVMKKRDYNMENLVVVSNPEDEAKMMTTEELTQYFSSQLH